MPWFSVKTSTIRPTGPNHTINTTYIITKIATSRWCLNIGKLFHFYIMFCLIHETIISSFDAIFVTGCTGELSLWQVMKFLSTTSGATSYKHFIQIRVFVFSSCALHTTPDSKVHGANMGLIWGRQDPGGPHELCHLGRDLNGWTKLWEIISHSIVFSNYVLQNLHVMSYTCHFEANGLFGRKSQWINGRLYARISISISFMSFIS